MNCRQAEPQIFAERDGALDDVRRAALASHLAECRACRRMREAFAATVETLRVSTQQVRVPDAELEWRKLRREIRGGAGSARASRRPALAWFALPLAAAAALAIAFFTSSSAPAPVDSAAAGVPTVARAGSAKAPAENASTVVFVDDKSGWTFVVAADDAHRG